MDKKICAYLIDPATRTVTTVALEPGNLEQIYQHLECSTFDCVRLNTGSDAVFVDDEGLMRDPQPPLFEIQLRRGMTPYPLAGRGLVIGADAEGESCDPTITLAELTRRITWLEEGSYVAPRLEVRSW